MALINLTQAAKLTGKNRSTIWRHIKRGKLSSRKNHDGKPMVDTSELIRVYGSIKEIATPQKKELQYHATPPQDNLIQGLISEIKKLREEQSELKEQLKTLTHRLEYKPSTPPTPTSKKITAKPEDDPAWPHEIKSFADTRLRNEIRARYKQHSK